MLDVVIEDDHGDTFAAMAKFQDCATRDACLQTRKDRCAAQARCPFDGGENGGKELVARWGIAVSSGKAHPSDPRRRFWRRRLTNCWDSASHCPWRGEWWRSGSSMEPAMTLWLDLRFKVRSSLVLLLVCAKRSCQTVAPNRQNKQ